MSVKKYILSFASIPIAMIFGSWTNVVFFVGLYYLLAIIAYVIVGVYYETDIFVRRGNKDKFPLIDSNTYFSSNPSLSKLKEWLEKEGFKLKSTIAGQLYLENKTVKIQYFSTLTQKLNISSKKEGSEDFLIYKEDEELKIKVEKYLEHLSLEEDKLRRQAERFGFLNKQATNVNITDVVSTFWKVCIKVQGYLFLVIVLINADYPNDFSTNIVRLLIFLTYFVIMEV